MNRHNNNNNNNNNIRRIIIIIIIIITTVVVVVVVEPLSVGQSDARTTGDQEVACVVPSGSGNILSWRLIMKYFYGHSLPYADLRRSVGGFLRKNVYKYWLTA